jgi:mannose-6-phosphate isomerase-like protein (cupin superfamily)
MESRQAEIAEDWSTEMLVRSKSTCPQRTWNGLVSHVLLQEGDADDLKLAVTWVDVAPGARQGEHSHAPQQVYLIVAGRGRMHVGEEVREVSVGDMVFIPSNAPHFIENPEDKPMAYVSAAAPAFRVTDIYDAGDILR